MKKRVIGIFLSCTLCIFLLLSIITAAIAFRKNTIPSSVNTSEASFDAVMKVLDTVDLTVEEDIPLTMSNISTLVLSNTDVEGTANPQRAGLMRFFYIQVTPGSVISTKNNSDEFKYSVICFSDRLIDGYADSGWVMPNNATDYTLATVDKKYITLNIARVDGGDVDIATVDLSDFVITYYGEETNLLDALLPAAEDYNRSKLKGYDCDKLSELSKKDTVGHACATDIHEEKATMQALKNAVEVEGFKIVEIDVRETADNVLVCYHDEILANTGLSVKRSTYEALKNAKADLATLEELLNYCKANNIGVVLDVKDIYSTAAVSGMFSIIEQNNLQDNFFFAGCPQFLLDNMPAEYQSVSYSNYLSWDDSYNGQNRIRCSNGCSYRIDLLKLSGILKAGHRAFELYDLGKSFSSTDNFKKDLSVFMYLCSVYDANYNLTLFNNITVPVLSEKELLSSMPKDFWDSMELIEYEEEENG